MCFFRLAHFTFSWNHGKIELLDLPESEEVFCVFGITVDDVIEVYERLKGRYELVLTTTFALDQGFTVDCPVVVGKAHGQMLELYEYGGDFVLTVMDQEHTKGTHWHPMDVEWAIDDIVAFMEGKSDYKMNPFRQV